jgi:hypothetical protein
MDDWRASLDEYLKKDQHGAAKGFGQVLGF